MDLILAVLAIVAVGAGIYWWYDRRRATPPEEDEWTLPPEDGGRRPAQGIGQQRLDRDALLRRDRNLDPSKWDNSPDAAEDVSAEEDAVGDDGGEDPPKHFDRDFLQRRGRDGPDQPAG